MKITKKKITASANQPMHFWCPKCRNQAVLDVDNDVHSIMDVDYQDHFICEECASEFLGEVTHDLKVKLTPVKDVEAATNSCNIGVAPMVIDDDDVEAATQPWHADETMKEIYDAVQTAAIEWFQQNYGDPEITLNDIDELLVVETSVEDDGRIYVGVRAELSYDGMSDLADALNPVLEEYDKYAYFDMEQPGIMNAYIDVDGIYSSVTGAEEIDNDDFDQRWDAKFGDPTTEVFTKADFLSWLEEVDQFE